MSAHEVRKGINWNEFITFSHITYKCIVHYHLKICDYYWLVVCSYCKTCCATFEMELGTFYYNFRKMKWLNATCLNEITLMLGWIISLIYQCQVNCLEERKLEIHKNKSISWSSVPSCIFVDVESIWFDHYRGFPSYIFINALLAP